MSAQANIIAFDGAMPMPISHTLVPMGVTPLPNDAGITADYRESLSTVPLAAQVRCSVKERKVKSGVEQVTLTVTVPVMESINGQNSAGYTAAPKVAYENTVVVTGYFHPRATIAERRLVRQLTLNIAGNISTSVAPVTSGAVPELIDQSIMPS